jgi:hypothetical protein
MTLYTPHQILSQIKWEKKPTTQLYMIVADYISENIIEVNERIQAAISQGQNEIDIDPNNFIN